MKAPLGFTIVELLIVIVVIAILAAVSIVAYNGVQSRARTDKIQSDLRSLMKAVMLARETQSKTLYGITGINFTAGTCVSLEPGTDLSVRNTTTNSCWSRYDSTLSAISTASGVNVTGIVDPYGRPYFIDENEGENGACTKDLLSSYAFPANGNARTNSLDVSIPLSGFSGCS